MLTVHGFARGLQSAMSLEKSITKLVNLTTARLPSIPPGWTPPPSWKCNNSLPCSDPNSCCYMNEGRLGCYPIGAPYSQPGYQVCRKRRDNGFCTDISYCPPGYEMRFGISAREYLPGAECGPCPRPDTSDAIA